MAVTCLIWCLVKLIAAIEEVSEVKNAERKNMMKKLHADITMATCY